METQPTTRLLSRIGTAMPWMRIGRGGTGEGVTVVPDAVDGGLERGTLADADATQDAAALFFGTKGDPGAAERTHQHRAPAAVARRLERHRAFRRGRMADGHAAGAQRAEIERPTLLAREAAHVRDGGIDQVIDETHTAGQGEHLVGEPVSCLARDTGGIAERDQRMQEPHDGRPRQARLGSQHGKRGRSPAIQRLQHREGAAYGLDHGFRHGLALKLQQPGLDAALALDFDRAARLEDELVLELSRRPGASPERSRECRPIPCGSRGSLCRPTDRRCTCSCR